jgi:polysaccharide biosynthesis transport protein
MRTTDRPPRPELSGDQYDDAPTDYLNLHDYFRIVHRRRWLIAGIMAVGLLSGALYNWMTVPVFEARAMVQLDMDLNVLGVDRPLAPLDQRDWMREFLPTQLGILESRELARRARNQLERSDGSGSGSPSGDSTLQPPEVDVSEAPPARVPTVNEIVAGRSVSMVRDTRLVNVGFRSTEPALASQVANALARAYLQQNDEFRTNATGEAADWLVKQVEEQRKLVEESEAALQQYRSEHGAEALMTNNAGVEQQNIVVQKLAELQAAATAARTATIEKEALYRQVNAAIANQAALDTVPPIASNDHIQRLKGELATLQRQLAQNSKELGERHPDIVKLQGAVQNTERNLQSELFSAARTIQNDFEAARSRERELNAALQRQKTEVKELNGKAVLYTALEREATTNREVLDTLLQRSREAGLARQLQTTNVRVVDWAEVPMAPVLPRKDRTMLIAGAGSGMFALALTLLLELFNTRLRSPDEVRQYLHIPVIGVVPQVKAESGRASLLLSNGAPAAFAELFQVVRTNLLLSPVMATGRTLLVTSAEPAEGKTVSAANIALLLARLNQRVILIDADLRNPQLHEVFGEEQQPGLADVLMGKTTNGVFRKTKFPGLWLMPAGSVSGNPSDLLGSVGFSELIQDIRNRFDWIVLDSSPVLAVTDPCLIARVVSGVLMVVDCEHTTREVAAAAVERLDSVQANFVGAMLNRVMLEDHGRSYLPYYHRDYKAYYPQQEGRFRLPELPPARANDRSPEAPASVVEG